MIEKIKEKEKAIKLRRKGLSYSEILKQIPVAKSSLSLWLRSVGLSKRQKQKLTKKKLASAKRGGEARRQQRLNVTRLIKNEARKEISNISRRDLWLIGTALYWAEGQKERHAGSLVRLGNSDPKMIKMFLEWLYVVFKIKRKDIIFRIYLHETSQNRLKVVKKHWSQTTGFSPKYLQKVTWKKNTIKTNRKNVGKDYYGLLDISVKRSVNLNRKIQGWIEGICQNI